MCFISILLVLGGLKVCIYVVGIMLLSLGYGVHRYLDIQQSTKKSIEESKHAWCIE